MVHPGTTFHRFNQGGDQTWPQRASVPSFFSLGPRACNMAPIAIATALNRTASRAVPPKLTACNMAPRAIATAVHFLHVLSGTCRQHPSTPPRRASERAPQSAARSPSCGSTSGGSSWRGFFFAGPSSVSSTIGCSSSSSVDTSVEELSSSESTSASESSSLKPPASGGMWTQPWAVIIIVLCSSSETTPGGKQSLHLELNLAPSSEVNRVAS